MSQPLDTNEFWALIERACPDSADIDQCIEQLEQELRGLTADDVAAYHRQFDQQLYRAYNWEIRGAAYCIMGGCGDDSFWDFRSGLIASGEEVFERTLVDPDSLAALTDAEIEKFYAEGFQYCADNVYQALTGEPLPPPVHGGIPLEPPAGEPWSGEDDLKQRYPKLYERFVED